MAEGFYFTHDYGARSDPRIKQLIYKHGLNGYGIFWAIIEDLYCNANALPLDYEAIAYDLRVDSKIIESIVNDFGLFKKDKKIFYSESIKRRLEIREEKSAKARESARKRWDKEDADVMRTQSESDAIKKEKKEKENKEINIKNKFADFRKMYPGARLGLEIEFENFKKKNKNFEEVVPLLIPAVVAQIEYREKCKAAGKFCAEWKNLKTWINNRCWEEELPEVKFDKPIPFSGQAADHQKRINSGVCDLAEERNRKYMEEQAKGAAV